MVMIPCMLSLRPQRVHVLPFHVLNLHVAEPHILMFLQFLAHGVRRQFLVHCNAGLWNTLRRYEVEVLSILLANYTCVLGVRTAGDGPIYVLGLIDP